MPKVSIIVPVYQAQAFLHRCVDSLLAQTLEDIEIILVNDASPDDSLRIMREYEEKHPDKIRVIDSSVNLRQGGARNLGIEAAKSEYIGFVDSDDWVKPEMFEALYQKALEQNSDMVGSQYFLASSQSDFQEQHLPNTSFLLSCAGKQLETAKKNLLLFTIGPLWTHLYRRSIMIDHDIRFLEKVRYEDNHFVRLYFLYVNRYDFVDQPFVFYYQNLQSTVHQKNQDYHFDRLNVERQKLADYKERGLFERYHDGIEIDFLQTFYINTLALTFNNFDRPPIKRLKGLYRELIQNFPHYRKNPYFKTAVSKMDRTKLFLARISPRLLSLPYALKNRRMSSAGSEQP